MNTSINVFDIDDLHDRLTEDLAEARRNAREINSSESHREHRAAQRRVETVTALRRLFVKGPIEWREVPSRGATVLQRILWAAIAASALAVAASLVHMAVSVSRVSAISDKLESSASLIYATDGRDIPEVGVLEANERPLSL